MDVTWAARSHPGLRRSGNEDSFCARPDLGLFMVADGMGGHAAGEVASRLAIETVEAFVSETAVDRSRTWPVPYDPDQSRDANRLRAAFTLANRSIGAQATADRGLHGMATTATGLLLSDMLAVVGHVGDSRIYLLRDASLQRITRDHSWVEEQVRAGVLTDEAARQHPWRNVVTRALSGGSDPQIDLYDLAIRPGDRILLCSDGLSSVVPDGTILEMLDRAHALRAACDALVGRANEAGGPDNITVLALELDAA